MSSLRPAEKGLFERLLRMSSGYVLGFSDASFGQFFADVAGVDIHSSDYANHGTSKANKLRQFWRLAPDPLVATALTELIGLAAPADADPAERALAEQCRQVVQRLLADGPDLGVLKASANAFDAVHLHEQIRRMEQSVDQDPALAIGTAKELVETCCKTILAERGKPVTGTPDIPTLTKETFRELKLVPEGIPAHAKGSDAIRRLLSNLASVCQGLAELRSLYGTGHGREGSTRPIKPRHARLAVGAAATLTTFLFQTQQETKM